MEHLRIINTDHISLTRCGGYDTNELQETFKQLAPEYRDILLYPEDKDNILFAIRLDEEIYFRVRDMGSMVHIAGHTYVNTCYFNSLASRISVIPSIRGETEQSQKLRIQNLSLRDNIKNIMDKYKPDDYKLDEQVELYSAALQFLKVDPNRNILFILGVKDTNLAFPIMFGRNAGKAKSSNTVVLFLEITFRKPNAFTNEEFMSVLRNIDADTLMKDYYQYIDYYSGHYMACQRVSEDYYFEMISKYCI